MLAPKCPTFHGKTLPLPIQEFSNMYDMLLQECVSKDVMCSYLLTSSDLDEITELQCLYLHKVMECDCLAQKLSEQMFHNNASCTTQTRAPQLNQTFRNTNPRASTSTGIAHKTNVSRPLPRSNQMKDKVVPYTSHAKLKKTEVEEHPRISSISNKTKSVTACNDSLNSRTSNANAVCATCGKCVFNSNHDACVSKFLNDVNARTKKPNVVPISTRKPKRQANKSVATPHKKTVASESTITSSKSYYRMLYKKTSKAWKWWIAQQCPSTYKWVPKTQKKWVPKTQKKWVPKVRNESVPKRIDSRKDHDSKRGLLRERSPITILVLRKHDLLTGNRGSDLYTISLQDTTTTSINSITVIWLKLLPTQAWFRASKAFSHLNFDYINYAFKERKCDCLPKLKSLNLLSHGLMGSNAGVASINGKKYILVIVDDYSRYTWTLFLRSKDETPEVLKEFLTMIQRNLQALVISVRTDRGTEFLNKTLNAFFKEEGIEHQTSTPRTPEQNGVVERRNRTLVEAARTMLHSF
ncbi:retrovirus-related pol polyprotein from transposon TNT 1-94 [Tanacetum coccineum]